MADPLNQEKLFPLSLLGSDDKGFVVFCGFLVEPVFNHFKLGLEAIGLSF